MRRCPICRATISEHTVSGLRFCSTLHDEARGIVRRELVAKVHRVELERRLTCNA